MGLHTILGANGTIADALVPVLLANNEKDKTGIAQAKTCSRRNNDGRRYAQQATGV